jgi:hypothetical protein
MRNIHQDLIPYVRGYGTARDYLEAIVIERSAAGAQLAHIRNTRDEWLEADWAVGATLTSSGLTSFDSSKVANGVYADAAWNTDTSVPGAYAQADFGAGNPQWFVYCALWVSAKGYDGDYEIQHSDDASAWTTVGRIQPGQGPSPQIPAVHANLQEWNATFENGLMDGTSAPIPHRYWRLRLANTPGTGPSITEWHLGSFALFDHGTERLKG